MTGPWAASEIQSISSCSHIPRANQLVAAGDALTLHADTLHDPFTHLLSVLARLVLMVDRWRLFVHAAPSQMAGEDNGRRRGKV
jgi:hypothetical protein